MFRALEALNIGEELTDVLDPDQFEEVAKGYHRGVLSSLKDDKDIVTTRRVCPYCYNDISQYAGFAPSVIISVVGADHVGKSTFLTALIHRLRTVTPRNFPVFCTSLNNEIGRKFKLEYEDPLISERLLLESAKNKNRHEPIVFTFSFTDENKPEINIAFFDIAGDDIADTAYMDTYTAYIRNSSGVLFLTDPLQFTSVGQKIMLKNNISVDTQFIAEDPSDVLNNMIGKHIHRQEDGVSNIPIAVVLTKTDLLEVLCNDGAYMSKNSPIFSDYTHKGFFNLTEFDNIDDDAYEFIAAVDTNFCNALKRRFYNLGFFAVSALGSKPIGQKVASFSPMRVDEPFLWILYQLGYIEGYDGGTV